MRLNWVERGGPIITPPSRSGFGRVVIERMVAKALNGKVAMDFAPEGLQWSLSMPTTNLAAEEPSSEMGGRALG